MSVCLLVMGMLVCLLLVCLLRGMLASLLVPRRLAKQCPLVRMLEGLMVCLRLVCLRLVDFCAWRGTLLPCLLLVGLMVCMIVPQVL